MKILHVLLTRMPLPPPKYGGTERVLWSLGIAQKEMGHEVRYLLKANTNHNPDVQVYDDKRSLADQIDDWADIVHFHWPFNGAIRTPFVCTEHGNCLDDAVFPINTIYLSKKHAEVHHAQCYVHNGLFWGEYGYPNLNYPKKYVHFLAKANWPVKNLHGAIEISSQAKHDLYVLGGHRISLRNQRYVCLSPQVRFFGMVGGDQKFDLIRNSQALIFPVLWDEPFGLAVIESLYLGCPVLSTPFGSLSEIICHDQLGCVSDQTSVLSNAITESARFDRKGCHEYAKQHFNHELMARRYHACYERVLANETLNPAPLTQQRNHN